MRRLLILTLAALLLVLAACAPKPYEPAGEPTGNAALDDAVLSLLQERCSAKNSEQDNLRAVYDFIAHDITYRPGTADTSGGFSDELTEQLALELLHKRKGNCDAQAALMAVLLRRMGYEAQLVQGTFVREEGAEPVGSMRSSAAKASTLTRSTAEALPSARRITAWHPRRC